MKRIVTITLLCFGLALVFTDTQAQAVISEIGYDVDFKGSTQWVELHNRGTVNDTLDTKQLCNFPAYDQIDGLSLLSGSLVLEPDSFAVIAWASVGVADGEMGLYKDTQWAESSSIIDYMQYGSAGHRREPVAVGAGVWTADFFVTPANSDQTLQLVDSTWVSSTPSPGQSNAPTNVANENDQPVDAFKVDLFPNPFTSELSIDVPRGSKVSILDISGRVLEERVALDSRLILSGSGLPSGLLLIRIENNDKVVVKTANLVR